MTDIHQRLSDATEGSRELDDSVVIAAFDGEMMDWWDEQAQQHQIKAADGSRVNVTPVTTSLDAALAMAERLHPCWSWSVGRNVHSQYWLAYALGLDDDRSAIQMTTATAMTGPLALCLAILSAKATDTGVGG